MALAAGGCCHTFTILRLSPSQYQPTDVKEGPYVELSQIDLQSCLDLLAQLKKCRSSAALEGPDNTCRELALQVLKPLLTESIGTTFPRDVDNVLHLCSLAVQFLCLGFLSYF